MIFLALSPVNNENGLILSTGESNCWRLICVPPIWLSGQREKEGGGGRKKSEEKIKDSFPYAHWPQKETCFAPEDNSVSS